MQMASPRLLLSAVLCVLACNPAWSQQPQNATPKTATKAELNAAYQRVCKLVAESYNKPVPSDWQTTSSRDLDKFENIGQVRGAASAAFNTVGDPRLRVLSPTQVEEYLCHVGSGFVGIGIGFAPKRLISEGLIIRSVAPESSAADAGLKVGDIILAVDGKDLKGLRWEKTEPLFEGDDNSVMKLKVKTSGGFSVISITRTFKRSLGLAVDFEDPNTEFEIDRVMYGSPADKAGVKEGDIIRGINGKDADVERTTPVWIKNQTGKGVIGTEITLKLERGGKLVDFSMKRAVVEDLFLATSGWYSQSYDGPDGKGLSRSGFYNLDWSGVLERVDGEQKNLSRYPGLILDLRGASGDDPDVVARMAARFIPSGEVMRYSERRGKDQFVVSYTVEVIAGKHHLRRSTFSRVTANFGVTLEEPVEILEPSVLNRNKLVVIIDGSTSGTAEALANYLRINANATLVGSPTKGSNSLVKTTVLDYAEKIYVQVPTYTLVDGYDNPLKSVSPDTPIFVGDPVKSAVDVLAGRTFYNNPMNITICVILLISAVVIFLLARSASREKKQEIPVEEPEEPMTLRQRIIIGVLFAAAFALVAFLSIRVERVPDVKDAKPELEAELCCNPEKHQKWVQMFRQLEKEVEGPIKFTVTADPDAKEWSQPGIRGKYQWVDSTGKVLSSGYNGRGADSKEEMMDAIKMAEANLGSQYNQKSFRLVIWHRQTPELRSK